MNAVGTASEEGARLRAEQTIVSVERAERRLSTVGVAGVRKTPEQLVAEADLHLRTGNYDVAIDTLSRVVELNSQGNTSESTAADAHFMLGKAYFSTGQLYSARRHFEVVTDRADRPAYAGMGGQSASRLVDIALETQRKDTLEGVLARVDQLLARSSVDSLRYARAKTLFAMERYEDSLREIGLIEGTTIYAQRGAYLRGTALMKSAQRDAKEPRGPDYSAAIEAFTSATREEKQGIPLKGDSREISDLAWLAVARLNYAVGRNGSAADAYQKVQRSSNLFSEALFELAWTYVRLGDYERGERALEALSVLDPRLIDGADGALLRGDLLLRSGRFQEADVAYFDVREKFDPLREQVEAFIETHTDPAVYYDKLTATEIEAGTEIPAIAIEWAREEAEGERIFAIVDDVARSRALVRRSRRIIALLRAALVSKSRVKLFAELSAELQETLIQQNRLAAARLALARGLDEVSTNLGARVEALRAQRRILAPQISSLPTTVGNIGVRESSSQESWNEVSQNLQRLQLEADHLKALVNGLRRVVGQAHASGINLNSGEVSRYRLELSENEKDLAGYFARIEDLRRKVELGRVQVGLGDASFAEDDRVREAYRLLLAEEVQIAKNSSNSRESAYLSSILPLLARANAIDLKLRTRRAKLQELETTEASATWKLVETEARAMEAYAARLDTMDQDARLLVGEVAQKNFVKVRDRLSDVVLRAEVGLAQQAWEVREEQRDRVRDLQRQRAREERSISEELREVLDDGSGGPR